ncbi:MAG: hypothetical protein KF872_05945 [Chitinophagales bacterium]|nr:hypothetical protein [Chitinophagales bacterium]
MNIRQIASGNANTALLLERMLRYSPLLDLYVEFFQGSGDATSQRKEQDGVSAEARALDSPYTGEVLSPSYFTSGRKLIGEEIKVDVARELMGSDIPSEFTAQLSRLAPGLANIFNDTLVNGDSAITPTQFNGLKKLSTGGQIITAAANGLEVILGNSDNARASQQEFLERLDEVIATCKGINKVVILNGKALSRLNTIAREYIQYTDTTFGKKIPVYNGVPLVDIEANGQTVLPFNETVGTSADTCSLYVASFEERAGFSFFTTREGLKAYDMVQQSNFYKSHVDFILDSALYRDKAVARLKGLKFAAYVPPVE